VIRQWGSATYPTSSTYDLWGRRLTLSTYRDGFNWTNATWNASDATPDITTWAYDPASGLLASKTDAASNTVHYTYRHLRLHTRQWARHNSTNLTTYNYTIDGRLQAVLYDDPDTPDITYSYTRDGLLLSVIDAAGTREFTYTQARQLTNEAFTVGTFTDHSLSQS
jgi:YD repeat-containing protein